jgi:epidermal growth factor receptor substrate 15
MKLAGHDVPFKLPPSLIPPSARVSDLGTSPFSPANAQSAAREERLTLEQILADQESQLSSIRVENAEIDCAFLRDKEVARELHKRIIETGKQVEALKADLQWKNKEAKQQKALLAIARKQLSTKESEKAKVEREHAEAVKELFSITRDKDTVDAELAIMSSPEPKVTQRTLSSDSFSSQPISMTPTLLALPPVKSNNAFEMFAISSPLLQLSPSPFSIQGSALPSLSSTESTSLPPSTTSTNGVSF